MEIQHLIRIFRPYWRIILAMTLLGLLTGVAASYVKSPRYTSEARLQVLPDSVEPRTISIRPADVPQASMLAITQNPADMIVEEAIQRLESRPTQEKVVQRLHLDEPKPPRTTVEAIKRKLRKAKTVVWDVLRYGMYREPSDFDAAVEKLHGSVTAQRVEDSYVLKVSVQAESPELASSIANTIVQVYLENARDLYDKYQQERQDFLKQQEAASFEELNTARTALLQYSQDKGVLSSSEQITSQIKAAEKLADSLRENDLALQSAQTKLKVVQMQLQDTDRYVEMTEVSEGTSRESSTEQSNETTTGGEFSSTTSGNTTTNSHESSSTQENSNGSVDSHTDSSSNSNTSSASTRGSSSESTRSSNQSSTSTTQSGESSDNTVSRFVTEESRVNPLQTARSSEISGLTEVTNNSRTQAVNPVYQQLQQDKLDLEREVQGRLTVDQQLEDQLRLLKSVDRDLIANDSRLAALAYNVDLAGTTYKARVTDLNQGLLATRPTMPAMVIEPASVPRYPSGFFKIYYALAGMAIGLILTAAAVLLIDYARMSVRTLPHAELALGLPVLATLPAPGAPRLPQPMGGVASGDIGVGTIRESKRLEGPGTGDKNRES